MDVLWPVLLETWIHFRGWSKAGVGRYPCFMQCGNSGDVPPGVLAPGSKRKRGKALTVELPKTLAIEVRQLLEVGARNITAPVAHDLGHDRRQAREDAAMEAWKQLLLSSGAVGPLSSSRPDSLAFVEISFSEHEDTQLRFGRKAAASGKAIPPCLFGAECQAFRVRGVIQPLQVYLTPSEQRAVDAAADPQFPSDGACLLCTRHTHQAMHAVYGALVLNPAVELGRRLYAAPHFQNVVNQPGGYRASAFLAPSSLGTHIVGTSGALRLANDPLLGCEYIDQECLKYRPGQDF